MRKSLTWKDRECDTNLRYFLHENKVTILVLFWVLFTNESGQKLRELVSVHDEYCKNFFKQGVDHGTNNEAHGQTLCHRPRLILDDQRRGKIVMLLLFI